MTHAVDRLFVVTGGPGSGKTTLLQAAAEAGFHTVPESGRSIIQMQLAIGGTALPWAYRATYAELMLDREMLNHSAGMGAERPVLFDRGVADVLAYARLIGLEQTAHLRAAAERFRYNGVVFIAPPWREIYANDAERKQDWNEAVRTYETLAATYEELGYRLAELPRQLAADRLRFVEETIANAG